jgi:hypothetical protein
MFAALLILIPLIGFGLGLLEQEDTGGAVAAVCVAKSEWSEQIKSSLQAVSAGEPAAQGVQNPGESEQTAGENGGVIQYVCYDSAEEVERAVLTAQADCGFVIEDDIVRRVKNDDWWDCIRVYTTKSSSITGMAKERIAGVIFKLYSEERYQDYMEEVSEELHDTANENADISKAREVDASEIVRFAQQAYETHLADGTTFSFTYDDQNGHYDADTTDSVSVENDTTVFPIKGVFAVLIFISGMCGMLEYEKDKREQRFKRLAPDWLTFVVNIWIPALLTSIAVCLCLWLTDTLRYSASASAEYGKSGFFVILPGTWSLSDWLHQATTLLAYQWIVVLYCCILRVILRRQETIAAAIPILALCSLVCAPVFVRLSLYVPVFKVLEKLFPVTYYLMLC